MRRGAPRRMPSFRQCRHSERRGGTRMAAPTGIGIIGGGGAFGRFIAEAVEEMGGARITAVAGSNPERTARAARDLGADNHYLDRRALIADPAVELVVISTPPYLHAPMGIDAARGGKAILMEK